ncbi:PREDICTED: mRNAion factor [Prunus dulcis]|uniref:PREDICTED: mRNAion factor n=1 Tax=Prunus dulcis TaxID=3755 RepID=A0A5E4FFY5_PRUDU|nr:PREDICTED: mRNAion factor [Prunus dulcis]
MELTQHGFLEELLLAPRRDSWSTYSSNSSGLNELFPINGWSFDSFEENPVLVSSVNNPPFSGFSTQTDQPPSFEESPFSTDHHQASSSYPFVDGLCTVPEIDSSYTKDNDTIAPPFPSQDQDYPSMVEDEEFGGFLGSENQRSCLEESKNIATCKVEMEQQATDHIPSAFNMGLCGEKRSKAKKLEGQPSKNLMAERRRRKRLNDRLSMLRSIVPKISKVIYVLHLLKVSIFFLLSLLCKINNGGISFHCSRCSTDKTEFICFLRLAKSSLLIILRNLSQMDRTSILGDTIDYMKELLERINKLQEEGIEEGTNQINLMDISKDLKPSEVLVRNSPKFDVERRDMDTRIDICCAAKPGLLLSTVNTIEALGLEIQQCVISCFNDFSMQASCSEGAEQGTLLSPEDIKQALFRNAGYGGRCL